MPVKVCSIFEMTILWNLEFWKFPLHQYLLLSRSLPHRKDYILFFFFLFTNWLKISEESCPKEFSHNIPEANKFNMAIPPFFFFFLTSILTHFKTWQTKKTGKKVRWKSVRWLMMRYHVKYCYSKRNIIDRVHSSFYKGLKHLLKKVKSIQNII